MRLLVTGADGFVGRHVVATSRARGDDVDAAGGPGPGGLDVGDRAAVAEWVRRSQPEAVLHLAGVSSVAQSHRDPSGTFQVNVMGSVHLLEAIRDHARGARVLLVGSGEAYGRLPDGHRAAESDPLAPLSPYAASKVAVEVLARQMHASQGLDVVLTRSFNHVGAGQGPNFVLPSFASQLVRIARSEQAPVLEVGDLTPVRDFLHVLDVVDAYLLLLEKGQVGEVYNVSSGEGRSIRAALDALQQVAGTRAEIRVDPKRLRPVEISWLVGDPSRLERLGWVRRRTFAQALSDVLASSGGEPFVQDSASFSTR